MVANYSDEEIMQALNMYEGQQPQQMPMQQVNNFEQPQYSDEEILQVLQEDMPQANRPQLSGGIETLVDIGEFALPVGGAIAGTALGTPFGPAGMAIGSGIGGGVGEFAKQGIETLRGERESINPKDVLATGALSAIGEGAGMALTPITKTIMASLKGLPKGAMQNIGLEKDTVQRLLDRPQIINKIEDIASPEYLSGLTNELIDSVQILKNKESQQFKNSLETILANKPNERMQNISNILESAINKGKQLRIFDDAGNLTEYGKRSQTGKEIFNVLNNLRKNPIQSLEDIQFAKSNLLDDIIYPKKPMGQELSKSEIDSSKVANEIRKGLNSRLRNILGSEYKAINQKASDILEVLNKPELKNIIYNPQSDLAASKIRMAIKNRPDTRALLDKVDNILIKEGIKQRPTRLLDELLDYAVAKDASSSIRTGLAGGFSNLIRQGAILPFMENIGSPLYQSTKGIKVPIVPNIPIGGSLGATSGIILEGEQ